ncbi:LysE family translocator [Arenibaculum sp.]|uniref:LysE family translocator n=1 Tax=Arenibaculum sp. TaxID=2865862 RepID=UPI002E0D1397|nr:LysE family translocator [Arenibaculum sp.]
MIELLPALALFALSTSITPGPNNIMLTASGATFGFRRTVPHMIGIGMGFPVMLVAVGLGLAGVFATSPEIHAWLRYAGIAYLLYLAWRVATSGRGADGQVRGRPLGVLQAALFQWVNPKSWVMAIGAVTTYTTFGGSLLGEVALIAAVYVVIGTPCMVLWAAFGTALSRRLANPRALRAFNVSMALLMVGSVLPMALA